MTAPPPASDMAGHPYAWWHNLLPPASPRQTSPDGAPAAGGPLTMLLVAVTLLYAAFWVVGHRAHLFDLDRQNDDARQHLFAYHAYGADGALSDDPVARDAMAMSPPLVRGVYRVLVPVTGLFVAAKVMQGVAWGIVLVGAWVLWRAGGVGRGGMAAACLFVFFMLHTPEITNRTVGGFPRSFAYPLMGLWVVGAIAGSERTRWVAAMVAAAVYPFAMLLLLGGEGFLRLAHGIDLRRPEVRAVWLRYGVLVALCFVAMLPYQLEKGDGGGPPTLEQAQADPAFGPEGRTKQLPFPDPLEGIVHSALEVFYGVDDGFDFEPYWPFLLNSRWATLGLMVTLGVVAVLVLLRRTPVPAAGVALGLASGVLYVAARLLAFRLYIPARYYEYGVPIAVIALLVAGVGLVGWRLADTRRRERLRAAAALGLIAFTLVVSGSGVFADNGIRLDRREDAELYDFIATLPLEARIAAHPHDGNDFPLWSARAAVASRENLLPWEYSLWPGQLARGEAVLRAMYATDRDDVLAFCRDWGVSHLLVRKSRYRDDVREMAELFEPFDTMLDGLLAGVAPEDLVLADPPREAVVFETSRWLLLDAAALERAWAAR